MVPWSERSWPTTTVIANLELTNRFSVLTGKTINNKPLVDCTAAMIDTPNRYMKRQAVKTAMDKKVENTINKLCRQKNGDKFIALFDKSLINGYNGHLTSREAGSVGGQMIVPYEPLHSIEQTASHKAIKSPLRM